MLLTHEGRGMMHRIWIITISTLLVLMTISSCGDSPAEPAGPDQEEIDFWTGYGIVSCFYFIWNQNIAGTPAGPIDITVPGPLGGSVHIIGSTANSGEIQSCDLTLEMAACRSMNDNYDLTLTGNLVCSGSWSTSQSYVAMGYTSEVLTFSGTVQSTTVNETGPVAINETNDGIAGTICGRSFSN